MRKQKDNDKPVNDVITCSDVHHKDISKVELYMTSAADENENKKDK